MTPEEKKELDAHVKAIAKILYKNTPPEKIETFEGIETAVRDQVLEHVSPKIAFFLSEKRREQQKGYSNHKKLSWENNHHQTTSIKDGNRAIQKI
jgi:hypothetical protein